MRTRRLIRGGRSGGGSVVVLGPPTLVLSAGRFFLVAQRLGTPIIYQPTMGFEYATSSPEFRGSAPPGFEVQVFFADGTPVDFNEGQIFADDTGNWFGTSGQIDDLQKDIYAISIDPISGIQSSPSGIIRFQVFTTPLEPPVITTPDGTIYVDSPQEVDGTCDFRTALPPGVNNTLYYAANDTQVGPAFASFDGGWAINLSLPTGSYDIYAKSEYLGHPTGPSSQITIVVL